MRSATAVAGLLLLGLHITAVISNHDIVSGDGALRWLTLDLGDNSTRKVENGISDAIDVDIDGRGFPIDSKDYGTPVYLRDNGVLTLGIGSDNADLSRPRPLPVLDILYLVAPFWHHLDNQIENREEIEDEIVEDGLVSTETLYKVYPLGLNSTNLNIVNNYVQNVLGDTDFIGSWMLLAQWNATYRLSVMDIEDSTNTNNNTATGSGNNTNTNNNTATGSGNNTNTNNNTASGSGTNTISTLVQNRFQAVLISNGLTSYTIFIYKCGNLYARGYNIIGFSTPESVENLIEGSSVACFNGELWNNVFYVLSQRDEPPEMLVEGQDYICDSIIPPDATPNILNSTGNRTSLVVSAAIKIPSPGLPFAQLVHNKTFVSADGVITFEDPLYYYYPQRFPSRSPAIRASHIVAPFWGRSDIRAGQGKVTYGAHIRNNTSQQIALFERIDRYIQYQVNNSAFQGEWMLVVKWHDIHYSPYYYFLAGYFNRYSDSAWYKDAFDQLSLSNSFTAVLVTDHVQSYAVFIYNCDQMETSGYYTRGVIGFNSGGLHYDNHPFSGYSSAHLVACVNSDVTPCSSLLYTLSIGENVKQRKKVECFAVEKEDMYSLELIQYAASIADDVPCTWRQAWRDRRFFVDFRSDFFCFNARFPKPMLLNGTSNGTTNNPRSASYRACYSPYIYLSSLPWGNLEKNPGLRASSLELGHRSFSLEEYEYEVNFKETCCGLADECQRYISRRPITNCSRYNPPAWAITRGDPHFTTLDGKDFTFNGWGEYTLAKIDASGFNFAAQGRTHPLDGTNATQFVAFAFGNIASNVEINCTRESEVTCAVLYKGINVDDDLVDINDTVTYVDLEITRDSYKSYVIVFPSGISATVTYATLPSFVLNLPVAVQGLLTGLLGNYNGNVTDDFIDPSGMMIDIDSSDSDIHTYGKKWQIDELESLFTYPPGQSHSSFANDAIWYPTFLDAIVSTASNDILAACNGDQQCIFDYATTGNVAIGVSTMETNQDFSTSMAESTNFPPMFSGTDVHRITIGIESLYSFTITEDNDIDITPLISNVNDLPGTNSLQLISTLNGVFSYEFRWMIPEPTTVIPQLTFLATDSLSATGSLTPRLEVCGCLNGGNCIMDSGTVNTVLILDCDCHPAWDGRFCENDVDGCLFAGCYPGADCIDNPAPAVGAECGPCPDGYQMDIDGLICEDIDECIPTDGLNDCGQICINTDGSFDCSCFEGYEPIPESTHECRDFDECSVGFCQQNCENTVGNYTCSCREGFSLVDTITGECTPNDACLTLLPCDDGCFRYNGEDACFCGFGFEVDSDNSSKCIDIDECRKYEGICEQTCMNSEGTYECSCWNGYRINSNRRTCDDIDECSDSVLLLQGIQACAPDFQCFNTLGDHECICPAGTVLGFTGPVEDTNAFCSASIPHEDGIENYIEATFTGITEAEFFDNGGADKFIEVVTQGVLSYCDANECDCREVGSSTTVNCKLIARGFESMLTTSVIIDFDTVMRVGANQLEFDFFFQASFNGTTYVLDEYSFINSLRQTNFQNLFGGTAPQFSVVNPDPTNPPRISSGLNAGVYIGIVIGAIALLMQLGVLIALVYHFCKGSGIKSSKTVAQDKGGEGGADTEMMVMAEKGEEEGVMEKAPLAEADTDPII